MSAVSTASQFSFLAKAAGAAASGDWSAVGTAVGQQVVGSVEIRSQFSPPVVVDPFAPTPPDAKPNPILLLVRPEFIVRDPQGVETMRIAPPTSHGR
jgi:hypothetical protein